MGVLVMWDVLRNLGSWIRWLFRRWAGIDAMDAKMRTLEEKLDKANGDIGVWAGKTGEIDTRLAILEVTFNDLYHRIDDVTYDLAKVRDRVLQREIKDEGERMQLKMHLERLQIDLNRLLASIIDRREVTSKSNEQGVDQLLAALLKMSHGIRGKRNTINSMLKKLVGSPDDSNPPPVAV